MRYLFALALLLLSACSMSQEVDAPVAVAIPVEQPVVAEAVVTPVPVEQADVTKTEEVFQFVSYASPKYNYPRDDLQDLPLFMSPEEGGSSSNLYVSKDEIRLEDTCKASIVYKDNFYIGRAFSHTISSIGDGSEAGFSRFLKSKFGTSLKELKTKFSAENSPRGTCQGLEHAFYFRTDNELYLYSAPYFYKFKKISTIGQ